VILTDGVAENAVGKESRSHKGKRKRKERASPGRGGEKWGRPSAGRASICHHQPWVRTGDDKAQMKTVTRRKNIHGTSPMDAEEGKNGMTIAEKGFQ